jgi:hypothetical protein
LLVVHDEPFLLRDKTIPIAAGFAPDARKKGGPSAPAGVDAVFLTGQEAALSAVEMLASTAHAAQVDAGVDWCSVHGTPLS